jgi:hypothetical protein
LDILERVDAVHPRALDRSPAFDRHASAVKNAMAAGRSSTTTLMWSNRLIIMFLVLQRPCPADLGQPFSFLRDACAFRKTRARCTNVSLDANGNKRSLARRIQRSPTQRTGVQGSGGTASGCDGVLSLDWNDYIATHPSALGQTVAGGETV